jgi:hypothetical protein
MGVRVRLIPCLLCVHVCACAAGMWGPVQPARPPPALHGMHVAAQQALSTAAFLIEAAVGEIRHLRRHCRLSPPGGHGGCSGGNNSPFSELLRGSPLHGRGEGMSDGDCGCNAPPQGLLTALLSASVGSRAARPSASIGAQLHRAASAAVPHLDDGHHHQADVPPLPSLLSYTSLLGPPAEHNHAREGRDAPGLPPLHLLFNQWQYKHEVMGVYIAALHARIAQPSVIKRAGVLRECVLCVIAHVSTTGLHATACWHAGGLPPPSAAFLCLTSGRRQAASGR